MSTPNSSHSAKHPFNGNYATLSLDKMSDQNSGIVRKEIRASFSEDWGTVRQPRESHVPCESLTSHPDSE